MPSAKMKLKKPAKKQPETEEDDVLAAAKPVSLLDKPRSWAIYGKSGTGKTTFAGSFPKPILLLDVRDQGTDSIADVKGVDVLEVTDWEHFEEIYYGLLKDKKYKTVIIDTITQLQQVCLEHVLAGKKKDAGRIGDWGTMTKREWGEASSLMKDWIVNFRDLPKEIVFLAQERISNTDEDEADNPDNMITPEVGPHVMKSVAVALNAAVSIIGNSFIKLRRFKKTVAGKKVEKEEVRYCLRIGPNPYYHTKIRKPKGVVPPAFVEDATYQDVIDIIKGE